MMEYDENQGRRTPKQKLKRPLQAPAPQTPVGVESSRSWWSYLTENASDELKAASEESPDRAEKRKVRFDKSVDDQKELYRQKKAGTTNDSSVLDFFQNALSCSGAFHTFEDQIERRILGIDHSFPDLDDMPFSGESDDSSISDPLSPVSSQSFEAPASLDSVPVPSGNKSTDGLSTTSSKYRDMLRRSKLDKTIAPTPPETPRSTNTLKSALGSLRPNLSKVWEPTTKSISRMSIDDDQSLNSGQKAAVSPLPKNPFAATFDLEEDVPTPPPLPSPPAPVKRVSTKARRILEAKYRFLEAVHDKSKSSDMEELSNQENKRRYQRSRSVPRVRSLSRGRSSSRPRAISQGRPNARQPESAAWVAMPKEGTTVGLSTELSSRYARNAPLTMLPEETESKVCTVPRFQQRMRMLKKLRGDRPPSTITTMGVLGEMNGSRLANASLKSHGTKESTPEYEYSSKRHSYIAYYQRGPLKASKTLRLYEQPQPPIFPTADNEVVVRVEVSTVTETDCYIRRGDFWGPDSESPLNLPIVPGVAFAGSIQQMDRHHGRLKRGDRVISLVRVGANSRHLCIGDGRLVKVPDEIIDLSMAACLPEVYLSAFQALHIDQPKSTRYRRNALAGKSILILGGTTKIGRALIELSLAAGSGTVYATARPKLSKLVEGAGGIPLDKDPHHWYSLLMGKMDIVVCVDCFDTQQSELKYEHIQTLKRNGKIILLSKPEQTKMVDLASVDEQSLGTTRKLYHLNVFDSWEMDLKQGKRDLSHLLKLLGEGTIVPKVLETIPLSKVARAQEVLTKQTLSGFILCEPWRARKDRTSDDSRQSMTVSSASTPSAQLTEW